MCFPLKKWQKNMKVYPFTLKEVAVYLKICFKKGIKLLA